jgi:hypothetical protein
MFKPPLARQLTAEQIAVLKDIPLPVLRSYVHLRENKIREYAPNRKCGHKVDTPGCQRCERAVYLRGLKERKVGVR